MKRQTIYRIFYEEQTKWEYVWMLKGVTPQGGKTQVGVLGKCAGYILKNALGINTYRRNKEEAGVGSRRSPDVIQPQHPLLNPQKALELRQPYTDVWSWAEMTRP